MAPITAIMRYEILYHNGGLYVDFKTESLKSLLPFLKYTFFSSNIEQKYVPSVSWMCNGYLGSVPNNYHFRYILTHFISQDIYNYYDEATPKMVGGFILRKAFT